MGVRSILVVDDDEDVRKMLCIVLSVEGYSAAGAADGLEALQHLRSDELPALIFVDLMMPKMDGGALIRTISADTALAHIPIAIISGQLSAEAQMPSPQVIAHLVKPVELDELLDVVHRFAGEPVSPGS
jgi:CheY-like chemotaxis protein